MQTVLRTEKPLKLKKSRPIFEMQVQNPDETPLFIAEEDGKQHGICASNVVHTFTHGKTLSITDLVT